MKQTVQTANPLTIQPFLKQLYIPPRESHKGKNGKALIIGGSHLFHAPVIWSAEIASRIVDMVHISSTKENNSIIRALKKRFINGIVIPRDHMNEYAAEDDVVLVGPGMLRTIKPDNPDDTIPPFQEILKLQDEAMITFYLTHYLIQTYPSKKFVFDAGSLQMMNAEWLKDLSVPAIVTPHHAEFKTLFNVHLPEKKDEIIRTVESCALSYSCTILLKGIFDIVSNGTETYIIEGGNAGLTKGGTGDLLAGLVTGLYAKNNSLLSGVLASYIVKMTGEELFQTKKYWYNIEDCLKIIPEILARLMNNQ